MYAYLATQHSRCQSECLNRHSSSGLGMSSPSLCHSILPVEKTRYSIEICYKLLWEWRDFGAKPSGTTELQQKVQQYLQPLGYEIDFSKDSTKFALIQLTQAVYRIKRAYRSTKDQSKRQRLRKTQSYCLQIDPDAMKLTPARAIQQLVAEKQAAEARIEKVQNQGDSVDVGSHALPLLGAELVRNCLVNVL